MSSNFTKFYPKLFFKSEVNVIAMIQRNEYFESNYYFEFTDRQAFYE
jgi:hypothetical protein